VSILNLGIVAHVDAGKTSLTERLLFDAGVIDRLGSVDAGSTQTDTLALERRRGITIKTAVASFEIRGIRGIRGVDEGPDDAVTVNLIDTPGHPDFIAEVERVLGVLDGAVLVVSAVEGVQAQTRVLMRTLQRLRIPTVIFVNKIDRVGADPARVLREITARLTPAAVPMCHGTAATVEALAEHDDSLLADYLTDRPVPPGRLAASLARLTAQARVHPVFHGSAITGAGVDALTAGLAELLPAAGGDPDGPVSGTVFKVDRDRIAYVRMFSGTVRTRDRVHGEDKVTAIDGGRRQHVSAGEIGRLQGLRTVRVGDAIGRPHARQPRVFAPPTLETVVIPRLPGERRALHAALSELAEQDPLINLRRDEERQELSVSLYGEVQKEVIESTLLEEYGISVAFSETTTIHMERPAGTGRAGATLGQDGNPYPATLELLVEPGPPGSGVDFRLEVPVDQIPMYVYGTVEHFRYALTGHVRRALERGGRHGWRVGDIRVTVTRCGYVSPNTTAGDFRKLVPLVLAAALRSATTVVCEPINRFTLDGPADTLGAILGALARHGAVPDTQAVRGAWCTVSGLVPAAREHGLERALPGLTRGEGTLESAFDHYRPTTPSRSAGAGAS
jgi:ribosomal protection tetracycline resistance protein